MRKLLFLLILFMATNIHATVSSTDNKIIYNGDGTTTVFPYNFKIFDDTDLTVGIQIIETGVETILEITTDYTVSGAGDTEGGNVTVVVAPETTEKLIIKRILPLVQGLQLVDNTAFSVTLLEIQYDKLTMMVQELDERVSRAILSDVTGTQDFTFPTPDAGRAIKWNTTEDGLINSTNDPDEAVADAEAAADAAETSALIASNSSETATDAADAAEASAASINLPDSLVGQTTKGLVVNAGETAYDHAVVVLGAGAGLTLTGSNLLIDTEDVVRTMIEPDIIDATKLEDNAVNTEHVNWGSGAGQIDTDEIPEGSSNKFFTPTYNQDTEVTQTINSGSFIDTNVAITVTPAAGDNLLIIYSGMFDPDVTTTGHCILEDGSTTIAITERRTTSSDRSSLGFQYYTNAYTGSTTFTIQAKETNASVVINDSILTVINFGQ